MPTPGTVLIINNVTSIIMMIMMIMIIDHGNIEDDNDATCRPMATALSRVR